MDYDRFQDGHIYLVPSRPRLIDDQATPLRQWRTIQRFLWVFLTPRDTRQMEFLISDV
jgi:hypothetical protein